MGEQPTVVDLFCGAGGMTLGFVKAGYESVYAVDDDPWSIETYNINFQGGHGECKSIESVDSFPQADIVIGGPPCQGFSTLGKNDPANPLNSLWRHFVRALEEISANWYSSWRMCRSFSNLENTLHSKRRCQRSTGLPALY